MEPWQKSCTGKGAQLSEAPVRERGALTHTVTELAVPPLAIEGPPTFACWLAQDQVLHLDEEDEEAATWCVSAEGSLRSVGACAAWSACKRAG